MSGYRYKRELVEGLLPCVWSNDIGVSGVDTAEHIEGDMPRVKGDPSQGFNLPTMTADVQRAFFLADLTQRQKRCLVLRYGVPMTYAKASPFLGLAPIMVKREADYAVDKITAILNGDELPPAQEGEVYDGQP